MHPAAYGGIQSATKESVGRGIGAGLLLLLCVETLLIAGPPQRQQGRNVGLRKRGITAHRDGHFPVRGPVHTQSYVVILHACRCIQINGRLNADRVGKGDIAALQVIAGPGYHRASFGNGDTAQQRGGCHCAQHMQVNIAGEFRVGVLEVQLRRREHMHVKTNMVRRGIRWREGLHRAGLCRECRNIEIRI